MGSNARRRIGIALAFCLAAAAVSGLLLLQHHGEPSAVSAVDETCGDGPGSGCDEVARSAWSRVAGFPVAACGLVLYLSLALALVLALLAEGELATSLAGIVLAALGVGLLVDLFLLGVQIVAIRAFCWLCISTYVLGALAFVALLPAWRALSTLGSVAARPDGRLALCAWACGSLALVGAIVATNATLGYRAAERQAALLGGPRGGESPRVAEPQPAPATSSPAVPLDSEARTGPRDLAYWRAQAERLQQTLDDPGKLEAYFTERAQREYETAPIAAIALEDVPARGPADAPVQVVEYSDFLCPYCRNLGMALAQFVPQAGGRVVVRFKNYPLDAACNPKMKQSSHPGACHLALGGVCAQRQGKFEAYHDRVFSSNLRDPQPGDVVRVAREAGLDTTVLQACLDDPKAKERLAEEIGEANRLGVSATPTLYVNGRKLPRINDFVAVVDKEARKRGFPPLAQ